MKKTLMSIVLLALSPAAFAGGGLIGSGGDGLLTGPEGTQEVNDVTVPLPPSLANYGTLRVIGTAGRKQPDIFLYKKCEKNESGAVKKSSCTYFWQRAILGARVNVPEGDYLVQYASSKFPGLVHVGSHSETALELQKIIIPAAAARFTVVVYRDVMSPEEQDKDAQFEFAQESETSIRFSCKDDNKSELKKKYCDAYRGDDYRAVLINPNLIIREPSSLGLFQFQENGFIGSRGLRDDQFVNRSRYAIEVGENATFISVFPGVYGIEFTDSLTGEHVNQNGIRVD